MPLPQKRFLRRIWREIICNSGFFFPAMLNQPAKTVLSYRSVMAPSATNTYGKFRLVPVNVSLLGICNSTFSNFSKNTVFCSTPASDFQPFMPTSIYMNWFKNQTMMSFIIKIIRSTISRWNNGYVLPIYFFPSFFRCRKLKYKKTALSYLSWHKKLAFKTN